MHFSKWKSLATVGIIIAGITAAGPRLLHAQVNEDCLLCHEDAGLTGEKNGNTYSVFVDPAQFALSAHAEKQCVECHADLQGAELPHATPLQPVDCATCHGAVVQEFNESLHGQALSRGDALAPSCTTCHGKPHEILRHTDPKAPDYVLNVPLLCGQCHREGTEVQARLEISQHNILQNYSLSLHGAGLFKKGLTVTAVCSSCHTAHHVLPHTDQRSTINKANVVATCLKCHANIEQVHRKVINGQLWESAPHSIPICIDCHQPHQARKIFYDEGMSDKDCLVCHGQEQLQWEGRTAAVKVDVDAMAHSAHLGTRCAQCHTGGDPSAARPCEPMTSAVDCSICHTEQVESYEQGIHGMLAARRDQDAPTCLDCHGRHNIKLKTDPASPTFPQNVIHLCGQCHREGSKAARRNHSTQRQVLANYSMSIHGKGLIESGLLVTATCVSCHTPHMELPRSNPDSTVHPANIPKTCGACHNGIYEAFQKSIHSKSVSNSELPLPDCADCHSAHQITRTDTTGFRLKILDQCGKCHEAIAQTYFDTYHGKVSKLGSDKTAKCQDCHGAHNILPPSDPHSTLSRDNIVDTCAKCHTGAHRQFAGYLTHATHHDPDKYPWLFYTFWAMTCLLLGTLLCAGIHTLLWLPASIRMMRERGRIRDTHPKQYRRFSTLTSKLHFTIIISFFGLAITGMSLKFSYAVWAQKISQLLGGFEMMGLIHRICALITFGYAAVHLFTLLQMKRKSAQGWLGFIFDKNSLMFNWNDLKELLQTLKWFTRRGPRPNYGRFTYWEKFDYFAVFWGITIIGATGLMLWFPEFFTYLLPGWLVNVATIIHSDEALLATAFIFTVHFFNTHFRADKFPMDTVMFTGRMSLEELQHDKPREYQEWIDAGRPENMLDDPPPPFLLRYARYFGFIALLTGLTLVALIIYAMLFEYR